MRISFELVHKAGRPFCRREQLLARWGFHRFLELGVRQRLIAGDMKAGLSRHQRCQNSRLGHRGLVAHSEFVPGGRFSACPLSQTQAVKRRIKCNRDDILWQAHPFTFTENVFRRETARMPRKLTGHLAYTFRQRHVGLMVDTLAFILSQETRQTERQTTPPDPVLFWHIACGRRIWDLSEVPLLS